MSVTKKQVKHARLLLAVFEEQRAAKADRKDAKVRTPRTQRRKTTNRKAVVGGAVEGHRCLTRKNREMFIADHDWATTSTEPVSSLVTRVLEGERLVGTWAIGTGHVAKALKVDESTVAPVTPESQGGKVKASKKGKKAKKAKAVEVEVVEVIDVPEWGSKEWIATTHPREKDTPRNAKGQPTARKEWPIRIALEETGKYDRNEVDAKVKAAYDSGLIET